MVAYLKTIEEFNTALNSTNGLIVIDFTASWCGPCQRVAPIYEKLSVEYSNVNFYKVDVDSAREISSSCDVKCMPTFQFYKGGNRIHIIEGANIGKVREFLHL